MQANEATVEHSHLAVSLFNLDRRSEVNIEKLTSETATPPSSTNLIIQRKKEIAISLRGYDDFEQFIRVQICPADGLSHGQLMIDSPHFLNNKIWCVQLPRARGLNFGLTLLLSRPGRVQNMTVLYDPPTISRAATLHIAMPFPTENEPVGILTYEINSNRRPVLTELGNDDPQSALIRMARTIALNGACARPSQRTSAPQPSTSNAPF